MTYTKILILVSAIFALLLPVASHATVQTLDFKYDSAGNALGNGSNTTHKNANWGVSISDCHAERNFLSETNLVSGVCNNLGSPDQDLTASSQSSRNFDSLDEYQDHHSKNAISGDDAEADAWERPGNVLIIQAQLTDDEATRPAELFTFEFVSPVQNLSLDVLDTENKTNDKQARKVYFHLESGTIVETTGLTLGNVQNSVELYSSLFDATKTIVNLPGYVAVKNLIVDHATPTTAIVSAPATIALILVSGFGIAYRRLKVS